MGHQWAIIFFGGVKNLLVEEQLTKISCNNSEQFANKSMILCNLDAFMGTSLPFICPLIVFVGSGVQYVIDKRMTSQGIKPWTTWNCTRSSNHWATRLLWVSDSCQTLTVQHSQPQAIFSVIHSFTDSQFIVIWLVPISAYHIIDHSYCLWIGGLWWLWQVLPCVIYCIFYQASIHSFKFFSYSSYDELWPPINLQLNSDFLVIWLIIILMVIWLMIRFLSFAPMFAPMFWPLSQVHPFSLIISFFVPFTILPLCMWYSCSWLLPPLPSPYRGLWFISWFILLLYLLLWLLHTSPTPYKYRLVLQYNSLVC